MTRSIRNFEALAQSPLRRDALLIAEAGLAAVDTRKAVLRKIRIDDDELCVGEDRYPLAGRRIFFIGVGKCAIAGAEAIESLLGERLTGGIALDVSAPTTYRLQKVEVFVGTHPLPSEVNERATERIVELLSKYQERDLVLMLVSGGGSTLLCLHQAPMTCLDEKILFEALTAKGAKIEELNTVRKHLSLARGGGLAKAAYPAEVLALIVSDVPGNNIEFIASGPTVCDDSTVVDAAAVLKQYGIALPTGVELIETPKEEKYFERVRNTLFLTSADALSAMEEEATRLGYHAEIAEDHFSGEARDVGRRVVERLHNTESKQALLYAGESTVTLGTHTGRGGRNQELALGVLDEVGAGELVLPVASDGHDNTSHAGAIADAITSEHARLHGLSADTHLAEHRAFDFFAATGDFLDTGDLESNVSDLIITLTQ